MHLQKFKTTPKNKMSAEKNILSINFIHLIHKTRHILSLPVNVTVSIFTVSAIIFLTLTPNIPNLFTDISQHIITLIHCTR